jgi:hypothetical protein
MIGVAAHCCQYEVEISDYVPMLPATTDRGG